MARKTKRTKITSEEKSTMICKNNQMLKKDFLSYLKSLKRSEGTIKGYDSDLNIVFTYILDNLDNKNFQKLTKRDIIGLQNWLGDNGCSSSRIRRIKSSISSLSNFCEAILADEDPEYEGFRSIVRKIENPPLSPVREKTVFEESELERLLDDLVDMGAYEKACCVALAMFGGRRKAELCRFKVSDFTNEHLVCDGALYKSSPILTKGGKMLSCYTLAKRFKPYLDLWLKYRIDNNIKSEWLFYDDNNLDKQINVYTLNSWANTFSRMTGRNFYFHSLRHYYCSALVRAGIPDSVVVDIIGWSSSEMLKIYDDNPKDEKISMFFKDGNIAVPDQKGIGEV